MSDKLMPTFGEIWKTLSSIDVSAHAQEKMGLKYLSWAWAWGVLMKHYPDSHYSFRTEWIEDADGAKTAEVWCRLDICGNVREMWLPVMDHKNRAIINPTTRDINDARMRCLVKAMAMFGLGHYIYAGEDLPTGIDSGLIDEIRSLIEKTGSEKKKILAFFKVKSFDDLTEKQAQQAIEMLRKKLAKQQEEKKDAE